MTQPTHLLLFDIDGTLVDVRGAGRASFAAALAKTWGVVDDLADITFAGATDLGVLQQLRRRHDLAVERETDFFRAMEIELSHALSSSSPRVYDGVLACVSSWQQAPGVVLGLVTGNGKRCAHVKLERAGIDPGIFDVGGYGDEHHDRNTLAVLALERATAGHGGPFPLITLVGDTPNDIAAAHHIGAVAVGVTTGHFDSTALLQAGADVVVDSLR
jgi:phosphoglycolate phosphatase